MVYISRPKLLSRCPPPKLRRLCFPSLEMRAANIIIKLLQKESRQMLLVFPSHRHFSSLPHRSLPCLYQWPSNAEDRITIWHRDSPGILSLLLRFLLVGLAEVVVPVWTALCAISSENKGGEEGGSCLGIQANILVVAAAFQTCGGLLLLSDKASCQRDKIVVKQHQSSTKTAHEWNQRSSESKEIIFLQQCATPAGSTMQSPTLKSTSTPPSASNGPLPSSNRLCPLKTAYSSCVTE